MKFFAFIMAFLMLTLPVLPCADDAEAPADKVKTEIVKQNGQQQEQEHNDVCSPFCHCTCCAGFSIHHYFTTSASLLLNSRKSYTTYLPDDLIEHSSPIWQPPQLNA
jgi:hypothetical protein